MALNARRLGILVGRGSLPTTGYSFHIHDFIYVSHNNPLYQLSYPCLKDGQDEVLRLK